MLAQLVLTEAHQFPEHVDQSCFYDGGISNIRVGQVVVPGISPVVVGSLAREQISLQHIMFQLSQFNTGS